MAAAGKRALVVGGSGFLGSSVCRSLIKHGYSVTSLSRNGQPAFEGLSKPQWANEVQWIQGSAFDEDLLKKDVMPNVDCVVHTLGILFENDYKSNGVQSLASAIAGNVRDRLASSPSSSNSTRRRSGGPVTSLLKTVFKDNSRNPLAVSVHNESNFQSETSHYQRHEERSYDNDKDNHHRNTRASKANEAIGKYERINRDSALAVLRAFLETRKSPFTPSTPSIATTSSPYTSAANFTERPTSMPMNPFVYVSAEDIFRPFVPDRYILTKREAEMGIMRSAETAQSLYEHSVEQPGENEGSDLERPARLVRPILVRPGLMFDYNTRPITRLPSSLLRLSTAIQDSLPQHMRFQTASMIASSLADSYGPIGSRGEDDLPGAHASLANLLSTSPLHVDVVAEAIARAIEVPHVEGVLGVNDMREMVEGKKTAEPLFGSQAYA